VGAACFYAGVRVEKGQVSSTSGRTALSSAFGSSAASGGAASARAGGVSRFLGGGAPGAGGGGTFGTVSSISGKALYVTDASGNTIKVTLSSATKVTKSAGVSAKSVHPGDTVVIQGIKNSSGAVQAATVSDTGARAGAGGASGAGGTTAGGSSGSGSANSAVGSLFGSGG
jgi:hypothetical protein